MAEYDVEEGLFVYASCAGGGVPKPRGSTELTTRRAGDDDDANR